MSYRVLCISSIRVLTRLCEWTKEREWLESFHRAVVHELEARLGGWHEERAIAQYDAQSVASQGLSRRSLAPKMLMLFDETVDIGQGGAQVPK